MGEGCASHPAPVFPVLVLLVWTCCGVCGVVWWCVVVMLDSQHHKGYTMKSLVVLMVIIHCGKCNLCVLCVYVCVCVCVCVCVFPVFPAIVTDRL